MRSTATCVVCGDRLVPRRGGDGRCATCYEYRRRNGRDRGFEQIERLTRRDIERELERKNRR